jgi:hypothetical protein
MLIINDIIYFLSGKKTYITGALMIALGALQGNTELALQGFGLLFLRKGVEKTEQ